MHLRSDGVLPPSSTRIVEPKRESISNKASKVLIDPISLLSILKAIHQSADETIRQMRPAQPVTTMDIHSNPSLNTSATHSNNQGREEVPPRLEDVNLEDISIHFLCSYSTHPNWKHIVSSCNDYGQTIAHICVTLGYFRLLQHLFRWQIDINVVDKMGLTALHYAYLFRQEECARLLIRAGANPFILDDLGRSPSNLNPSLEITLHPVTDSSGDSSAHSTSPAGCTIEMPEEAEGLYAKHFLVQQWRRKIENERNEMRETPPPRYRKQDVWSHPDAASTAPTNYSVDERVGGVVHRQSFSSTTQLPQGIPTLVASQKLEALIDAAIPFGAISPPAWTSTQAKVDGPGHTESQGYRPLTGSASAPSPHGQVSHSGA
jgi:hypothetical protein